MTMENMGRASANQRYVATFDPRYSHPHAIIDRGPLCLPSEEYPQVLQRFATREDLQSKLSELRERIATDANS